MPRTKKRKKLKVIQSEVFLKDSPYVLDLKKVALEKKTASKKKEKVDESYNLSEFLAQLTIVGFFYFLISLLWRVFKIIFRLMTRGLGFALFFTTSILKFIIRGLKFIIHSLQLTVRGLKFAFLRFLKFLKFSPPQIFGFFRISPPRGWSRALASFLIISFILILPFQAFSYYNRFEDFLTQNKLSKIDFGLLKFVSQKESLEKFLLLSEIGKKILGYEGEKRYLFIFQNNNELRPTGGFIGSFALVDVKDGKIKKMEIPPEGSYALQGWLRELVLAPEPLQLINSRWEFQDANWFPDFPASAQKISWFYGRSGGPSVDGVISFTSSFFQNILKEVGAVEMPDYDKVIESENFVLEIQKATELEYDKKENKPKQIITDLAPKVIERILEASNEEFVQIAGVVNEALISKDLLFYFKDKEIEEAILDLGWGGEIKNVGEESDYLMVVDTNIAGGKTDAAIYKKIHHQAEIAEDGSIINQVTITREHQGVKGELFTGFRNVDYLRIYVPKGSVLLRAEGFEIPSQELFEIPEDYLKPDEDLKRIEGQIHFDTVSGTRINKEFGKTVFGNWVQVNPGETTTASFTYKLPFKLSLNESKNKFDIIKKIFGSEEGTILYSLFVQKQPGSERTEITSEIKFPYNWKPVWKYPENLEIKNSTWFVHDEFRADHFYGAVFKKIF